MASFGDYPGDFILKSSWRPGDTVQKLESPGLSRRVDSTACIPFHFPGKNVRRDPANPTWDPRLIPGGIPPEIGGIPPGIPPGIMERPGRHPTWDPN